jgi:ParB-like nuclease domain
MSEALTALFNTVELVRDPVPGIVERVPLDQLVLAPNHRKAIDREAIHRLAHMLATTGQLTPCIGRRAAEDRVIIYAGQRRLLAARASHELAGSPDFEGLAPVTSLIVLLLDHEPGEDEIRRIQAHENAREPLCLRDQQDQFRDCWQVRAGLPTPTGSPSSAPTSASPPARDTASAASSPSLRRFASGSPSGPPATSCRYAWRTASPTCTMSPRSSPRPSPHA